MPDSKKSVPASKSDAKAAARKADDEDSPMEKLAEAAERVREGVGNVGDMLQEKMGDVLRRVDKRGADKGKASAAPPAKATGSTAPSAKGKGGTAPGAKAKGSTTARRKAKP